MSVCDSASVDIESDGTIAAGETAAISETDFPPCNPQANSPVLEAFPMESGYVTKGSEATNLPLDGEVEFRGELWNGQGLGSTDETVIENPNLESASTGTASIGEKREHKLGRKVNPINLLEMSVSERDSREKHRHKLRIFRHSWD